MDEVQYEATEVQQIILQDTTMHKVRHYFPFISLNL